MEIRVNNTITDYDSGFIYKEEQNYQMQNGFLLGNEMGHGLQFFSHAEGYVEPNCNNYDYIYQYKDHLGNIRLSYKDNNGNLEIVEENNYYPFGLKHKGYNNVVNGSENKYQTFQGQEEEKELGKNTYAYQWRDYDPAIARFNKIDRFAEKYNNQTPYHFTKNNPVLYIEIAGDSLNVSGKQNREHLNKSLKDVFGDKASNFSYTKSGNLIYNGNGKKDFKGSQRKAFKGLNKVMSTEETVNLVYSETHTSSDGTLFSVMDDFDGGLYDPEKNMIVISPNANDIQVTPHSDDPKEAYKNHLNNTTVKVEGNPTTTFFHEIGEVNAGKAEYRGSVIDYENKVREVLGMKSRIYDVFHHKKPKAQIEPTTQKNN